MKHPVLFIHGAGEGAYEEDGRLVDSLRRALGSSYEVHYPEMPTDDDATSQDWTAPIESEWARLDSPVVLVGHSVGASVLAYYLSRERVVKPIAGLYLLAAPFWGADGFWTWDEMRLPPRVGGTLASLPRVFLYHSRDDDIVPFSHLALYAARLPQATVRVLEGRGHQLGEDLRDVARDIEAAGIASRSSGTG